MLRLLDTGRPRLLLTLFCLLLWVPGFFTLPPGDRDESRFVQATKQMLETGDFVRIQNGAEARNRKPIGIHWLQAPFAAAAQAAGVATVNPVWPYRIPSALGGWVAVMALFSAGEVLVGRRAAMLGAAMLAGSVLLVVEVHIAKTDAALLAACTVAMAVLARAYVDPAGVGARQAALFWLAIGAGVLLKGPVGPMVAGLPVLALLLADRRAGWVRGLRTAWGLPLAVAVVLPWFVAIGVATEGRFFADAVGGDLGRKLSSGDDAHGAPPGLHLLLLPLLLFPASAAVPGGLAAAWRDRVQPPVRFLLAWVVPAWLVFEAVPTKLPHYTLPLYPALCLLAARWVLAPRPVWRWPLLLPGLAALLLGGAFVAAPVFLGQPALLGVPAAAACLLVGGLAVRGRLLAGLVAAPLLYWSVLELELPRLQPLWIAPRVAAVLPPGRLGAVGYAEPSLMVLAGTGTQWLLAREGAAALAAGRVDTLLCGDRDLAAVNAEAARLGLVPRVVARVPGFNYSRGRWVTLTLLAR